MVGKHTERKRVEGFTIVELLIVVVVIAILAAITIVAYNGIQDRAKRSAVQSAISSGVKALEASKIQAGGTYPATLPTGMSSSDFIYEPTNGNQDYCLTQVRSGVAYFATAKSPTPTPGTCQGMVAWWPLNNGSTSDVLASYDGVNSGGVSATGATGVANTGWNLPGDTTPRYINTPLSFSPNAFTASIWVNPDGGGPSSFSSIMSTARDCCAPTTYTGMQIDYNRTSLNLVGRVFNGSSSGPNAVISAPGIMVAGQWKHIVLTSTGTLLALYVNGSLVGTQAYAAGTPGASSFPLKLGGGGWTNGSHTFGGVLDDARVYNRALSADEIAQMYSYGAQ